MENRWVKNIQENVFEILVLKFPEDLHVLESVPEKMFLQK